VISRITLIVFFFFSNLFSRFFSSLLGTNHLDLYGLDWLIQYITKQVPSNVSIMIVSHDRSFLDQVCTDIIILSHQTLSYFVGNYTEYERQQYEKSQRDTQLLDAASRQLKKANEFIQRHQHQDPNKQRQAKMMKDKKLDRIGNYRDDGKRYKQYSLKTLDEKSLRRAQKVEILIDDPILPIHIPNPTWPISLSTLTTIPIIRMEDVSFAYHQNKIHIDSKQSSSPSLSFLLNSITLQ
jgi:ATPase subunit of ABC transporter with duplicated ATPase domains